MSSAAGHLVGPARHGGVSVTIRTSRHRADLVLLGGWVLALLSGPLGAQTDLSRKIAALVSSYERTSRAAVGLSVVDVRTGKKIIALQEARAQPPASNQKILTAAFALARLGGDYTFTTLLVHRQGDLVVSGSFDPTLGDPVIAKSRNTSIYAELDRWAGEVKRRLGQRLAGDIIVLTRRAGGSYRHDDWPTSQYKRWYVAPVAEVNFNDNCFDVTFGLAGSRVIPHVVPASYLISVTSRVKRGSRHIWDLRIGPGDSALTVTGTIKTATRDPLPTAVNDPPLLFGRVLADRLKRAGVAFSGQVRAVKPAQVDLAAAAVVAQTRTPLADVIARANKRSLNMAAEGLLLCAGDGTWAGSGRLMRQTLVRTFALADGDLTVRDGSGLSRKNAATARAIATVLAGVLKRPCAAVLLKSLPVSGGDGTLAKRLSRRGYAGRVLAKTGYISGVSALSGYVLDAAFRPAYAFSILISRVPAGKNWQAKQFQDAVAAALVDSLPRT